MEPHLFSRNIGWENAGQGLYVIHNMLGMIRLVIRTELFSKLFHPANALID